MMNSHAAISLKYKTRATRIRKLVSSLLYVAIAFSLLIFTIFEPRFFTLDNLIAIVSQSVTMGLTALGLTFVLSVGEMDFASGAEFTVGACCLSLILSSHVITNYWIALIVTILFMALMGSVNAFLHTVIGIPSFIATLGISTFSTGYLRFITDAKPLFSLKWPKEYVLFGQGYLFGGAIPITFVIFLIFIGLSIYISEWTMIGRKIYAVGGNPTAAKNIGINIRRTKFAAFILCAVMCGLAGIIRASMLNQAKADMGDSMLIQGMTCVMLGATCYRVGTFNAVGSTVATLLISVINNGLTMINASTWAKDYVLAVILFIAVGLISLIRSKFT